MSNIKKFIGDKAFYRRTVAVMLPIVIQNGITQFVNLLDNIMVGQVGTEAMTGVSITNQLIFVFNLCIFGAVSGAGIFGAQFAGKDDAEGMRYTFRFKVMIAAIISAIGATLFNAFREPLISLFLRGEGDAANIAAALEYGKQYCSIMSVGLPAFAFVQVYSSSLREKGETMIPMAAGVAAVLTNLVGNYILIFGKLGAPALGSEGAAIATVISRFVELGIVSIWTHTHAARNPFIVGAYRSMHIPRELFGQIVKKGAPILANEALWSAGTSMLVQCYSVCGYEVVSAMNISQTIARLFDIITMAFGSAISIIVGQALGSGDMRLARDVDNKLFALAMTCSLVCASLMALFAPLIARVYNVTDAVKALAVSFLYIVALAQPIRTFCNACYFTLRSGGKTFITFLFDSVFVWVVSVPLAYSLTRFTALPIVPIYLACQLIELVKCVLGFVLVKKGSWMKNLIGAGEKA